MTSSEPFLFVPAPDRAELLFEDRTGLPHISVYQQGDIRWLGFGGPAVQSVMSVARPDALLLPYMRAMLTALLLVPGSGSGSGPLTLLNLGLGGGAFDRFFRRRLPEVSLSSVEQDERIVAIARRWFGLDPDARCTIAPAREHVARTTESADFVFCDLHDGEHMAGELSDPGFWRDCALRLRPGGVLAINALAGSARELLGMLGSLQESFSAIALREIADHRNIVVFALQGPAPDPGTLVSRCEALRARTGITVAIDPETLVFVG